MRIAPRIAVLDAALALGLLAAGLLELEGDVAIGIAAAALVSLPLALRRRAPLAVALVVGAGFILSALQETPPEPLSQLVALLVAPYSLGAYAPLRDGVAGALALLVMGIVEVRLVGDEDYVFFAVLLGAAFAAGRVRGSGHRREQALEHERDAALLEERERIARELHDVVAHAVTVMVMQAGAAGELLDRDPGRARTALDAVQAAGREAVADLGRMLGLLRSAPSEGPQPGLRDLGNLLDALRGSGLEVEAEVEPATELPAALDLTAYRVAQEALTNALRHGDGTAVLRIGRERGVLTIEVANGLRRNGAAGTGHGLVGMRERVALYGGTLEAHADDGRHVLRARLPVP